jgi:glycosyltransferase involved in cell wall biosynthesis
MDFSLSIIIPTINKCSELISETIRIFRLKKIDFEVILICDSNEMYRYHKGELKSNPYLKVLASRFDYSGPGSCRNIGIENSSKSLITFLDADDEILIRDDIDYYDYSGQDILLFDFDHPNRSFARIYDSKILQSVDTEFIIGSLNTDKIFLSHCLGVILKRDFLMKEDIRFPETSIVEDITFMSEVLLKGTKISRANWFKYKYSMNLGTTKNTIEQRSLTDIVSCKSRIKGLSPRTREQKIYIDRVEYFLDLLYFSRLPVLYDDTNLQGSLSEDTWLDKHRVSANYSFTFMSNLMSFETVIFGLLNEEHQGYERVFLLYCAGAIAELWKKPLIKKEFPVYVVDDRLGDIDLSIYTLKDVKNIIFQRFGLNVCVISLILNLDEITSKNLSMRVSQEFHEFKTKVYTVPELYLRWKSHLFQ